MRLGFPIILLLMDSGTNISLKDLSKKQLILIIETQSAQIRELISQVENLNKRVDMLTKELERYKHPKNSSNSSIPPSKDENRPKRNQSLRQKSDRKAGGQKGHKGTTLQMAGTPDETINLVPQYCNECGADLTAAPAVLGSKRQAIEIPPIKPIYKEYRCFHKQCDCGHKQVGDYPSHITNHIQYGPSVEAAVGYYSVYQYLPFNRMKQMFAQVFNLPISEGTLVNIVERLGEKAQPIYEQIRLFIENSHVVGGDETGIKVNGEKWWGWIWQNIHASFIQITSNRKSQTINELFPNGFPNAILNSDRWRPHLSTNAHGHQLCTAHLLRDLNYLIELEKAQWAKDMKTLFQKALELKREKPEHQKDSPPVIEIESKADELLEGFLDKTKTPKTLVFRNAMKTNRQSLFRFLYQKEVPPDNNGSERGVRNFKVKQKISGQFKTSQNVYATLRSIIDTSIKRRIPVMQSMTLIAQMPIG